MEGITDALTLAIKVDARMICKGVKEDCHECPIAIAVGNAAVGTVLEDYVAEVQADHVVFNHVEEHLYFNTYYAKLPQQAVNFIEAFDSDGNVEPFEFDLEVKMLDDNVSWAQVSGGHLHA